MKKVLLSIFVFASMSIFAQTTIETQLVVTTNDGTNGGSFKVAIQAKGTNLTASNTIGSATIDVYYTAAHIAPVIVSGTIVSGTYDATIGSNYTRSLNYVSSGPYVRLSISGSNINGNGDGTPVGLDLTSSYQTIATINFTISNNTVTTSLTINTGSLTLGLFDSHNNSNTTGVINAQTMSAPVNITDGPLPVELTSFTATTSISNVALKWTTATEINNYGFEVEKSIRNGELGIRNWEKVGFIQGSGNSNSAKEYSYVDKTVTSGNFLYRLKQIDNDGNFEYSKEIEVEVHQLPTEFSLDQNYPNPFNPSTSIQYSIVSSQNVSLKVFNVLGKEVAVLVNEKKEPGTYTVTFSGAYLASGTYFYRLQAGEFVQTKKFILMK
ncbi:MAG: T9SS type A sorting domain-containing protein [Ignavibacteriaceae bacterium]|jgi:hypothetical protein